MQKPFKVEETMFDDWFDAQQQAEHYENEKNFSGGGNLNDGSR